MRSGMEKEVKKVLPDANIFLADSGREALSLFKDNSISLVFLDVEMPGMSGLEVAKELKDMKRDVNIVMTTAYPNYAVDAYRLHIGGYLMKPVDAEDIREELYHLSHPIEESHDPGKLRLQCFGEFKAEFGGEPVRFSEPSQEILAYLAAKNGASASKNELCDVLWEDEERDSKKSYHRSAGARTQKKPEGARGRGCFTYSRNEYSIRTELVDCDYYEFLKGNPAAIRAHITVSL